MINWKQATLHADLENVHGAYHITWGHYATLTAKDALVLAPPSAYRAGLRTVVLLNLNRAKIAPKSRQRGLRKPWL
jgi:hypothetical protein